MLETKANLQWLYTTPILLLWDLRSLCIEHHLWPLIYLSLCLCIYLCIYLSMYLSFYLYLSIYVSIYWSIDWSSHNQFTFPRLTVAKEPLIWSFENMEIYVKVLSERCSIWVGIWSHLNLYYLLFLGYSI